MTARFGAKPFPIQMEVEFIDRLNEPVRDGKAKSASDIIRTALERFDFPNAIVLHPAQVQLSVRLPVEIRKALKKTARTKHTSVGQLVRAAVEAYLPELEGQAAGQMEMPIPVSAASPAPAPERAPRGKLRNPRSSVKKKAPSAKAAAKPRKPAQKPAKKRRR